MTGFYRKFIEDDAKIASPILRYLQKGARVKKKSPKLYIGLWKMLKIITQAPILRYHDINGI